MKSLTRDKERRERKVLLGSEEFKKQNKNKHQEQQSNVARGKKEENKLPPPNPMDVLMKYHVLLECRGKRVQ